jgi:hypothetical protein
VSRRAVVVLGGLVLAAVAVIVASTLLTGRIETSTEVVRLPGPLGFQVGPFGRGLFGRFGPFGRHLGGWRGLASALGAYCFLYLAGLLTLLALPRPLRVVRDAFGASPRNWLRLLGIGALAALLVLLLAALGLFTFVLFPLPLLLVTLLIVAAWAGVVGLALALGSGLRRAAGLAVAAGNTAGPMFDFGLGLLLVFALGRIPFAGWVIVTLIGALALGAMVVTRLGTGGVWSLAGLTDGE